MRYFSAVFAIFIILTCFTVGATAQMQPTTAEQKQRLLALSDDDKRETIKIGITKLTQHAAPDGDFAKIQAYADKFPKTTIGVGFSPQRKPNTSPDTETAGLRITSTWKSAAASKAGVKTGDWLQSVNGISCDTTFTNDPKEDTNAKLAAMEQCANTANQAITSGGTVSVVVEHADGKTEKLTITATPYGQEIKDFVTKNLAAWTTQYAEARATLKDIDAKLTAAKTTAELDACLAALIDTYDKLSSIQKQFLNYRDGFVDKLPEPPDE